MIKRNYFYLIETQETMGRFIVGIVTIKSWKPDPVRALNKALKDYCEMSDKDADKCKVVQFNRI